MIQLRDPCKRCIVRPVCREKCKAKLKYYKDRLGVIPYIIVWLSVIQVIIYAAVCAYYPDIKNHFIFNPACTGFMFLSGIGMVYKFMHHDLKDRYSSRWKNDGF